LEIELEKTDYVKVRHRSKTPATELKWASKYFLRCELCHKLEWSTKPCERGGDDCMRSLYRARTLTWYGLSWVGFIQGTSATDRSAVNKYRCSRL